MIDDLQDESAALYALDLLAPAECAAFEARVAADPALAARVRELRETAAALAHAAPPAAPPAVLRDRILRSAADQAGAPRSPFRVTSFATLIPWAIAACVAVAAAWTARLYEGSRSENAILRDQGAIAALEMHSLRDQLDAERIVNQRELTDTLRDLSVAAARIAGLSREIAEYSGRQKGAASMADYRIADLASTEAAKPRIVAVALWCPSMQAGILAVSNLPRLPEGKQYQLWVIDPQYGSPVSGGVFTVNPSTGQARIAFGTVHPIKSIAKFAVSLEREGGVPSPEGPIVLLSDSPRLPD